MLRFLLNLLVSAALAIGIIVLGFFVFTKWLPLDSGSQAIAGMFCGAVACLSSLCLFSTLEDYR